MNCTGSSSKNWKQVYSDLRSQIEAGQLLPGEQLPTIRQLSETYDFSSHAARKILTKLREDGFAQSWQGAGYRVAKNKITYHIGQKPWFRNNLSRLGVNGETRMVSARMIRVPKSLLDKMDVHHQTQVYQSEIVRWIDDMPVILARNHFPADRFEGILDHLAETGSVIQALAKYGIDRVNRSKTQIEARLPTAHEALMLNIPTNQPVLTTTGVNTDLTGRVVEVSLSTSRADCLSFEI